MGSGGHANSGPAPDPNALRRGRADDRGWTTLPVEGFKGETPTFPLPKISVYDIYWADKQRVKEFDEDGTAALWDAEVNLWEILWAKPQAFMWAKLGLEYEVAAYVRAFIESTSAESNSGLKTAVLRMASEVGLSLPGMASLRWKFSEDEVAARREAVAAAPVAPGRKSAKDRLAAIANAG